MAAELNFHPFRLGFSNGVLHLRTDDNALCVFHEGADESVTFKVGRAPLGYEPLPYEEYNAEDPLQAELDAYMAGLFPNPELRAYMWRKLASYLEGTNREQMFDIWHGTGGNGKTTLRSLLVRTLGEYAAYIPEGTLFTASDAASVTLQRTHPKRFIHSEAWGDEEALHPLRIRQLTEAEEIAANQHEETVHLKAKGIFVCNVLPPLPPVAEPGDADAKFHLQVIPFEAVFHGAGVGDRLDEWRAPFLSRLVHIYKTEYALGGLGPTPAIVQERSIAYRGAPPV
jgi:phage/plasmid-associated DNA primase